MDWTAIVGAGGSFMTVVGLVVWLVKNSFRRQDEVTNRFLGHMEKQAEASSAAFQSIATSVNNYTDANKAATREIVSRLDQQGAAISDLARAVRDNACRAKEERR